MSTNEPANAGEESPSEPADPTLSGLDADLPLTEALGKLLPKPEGERPSLPAQAGFIDGPRVLANMAHDFWAPHWFAHLSERLATHNGILLMGLAVLGTLLHTGGDVSALLIMYSINVFLTFSLSMLGMCRHWWMLRGQDPLWRRRLSLFVGGAVLCLSAAEVDSGSFKGSGAVEQLKQHTENALGQYVDLARRLGMPSTSYMAVGTDVVDELEHLCLTIARQYPKAIVFAGQLIFQKDRWYHRLLHNQTAFSLQRRLQWAGVPIVILPTRVR